MNAVKGFVVGVLVCLGAGQAFADTGAAPQVVATAWTPAQSASPAMLQPGGPAPVSGSVQHVTAPTADESHSNGRLMLIGGLLIGVIALRSRKNPG